MPTLRRSQGLNDLMPSTKPVPQGRHMVGSALGRVLVPHSTEKQSLFRAVLPSEVTYSVNLAKTVQRDGSNGF